MNARHVPLRLLPTILVFAVAACAPASTPTATSEPTPTQIPSTPTQAPIVESTLPGLPETTVEALLAYLNEQDYQNTWRLWPGKGELYAAPEPHGLLLTTYVNDVAHEAIVNKSGAMPNGAIIVKENYTPDAVFDANTIMYKVKGYNPGNSDWFWVKVKADGSVEAQGQVAGCQACHGKQKDNDYIFTSPLK